MSFTRKLDILGPAYGITMGNEYRLKSRFGAFLSLIFFISFLSSSGIFISQMFDYDHPNVSSDTFENNTEDKIEIGLNNVLPIVYVRRVSDNTYLNEEEALRKFEVVLNLISFDNSIATPTDQTAVKKFKSRACENMKNDPGAYYYPLKTDNYDDHSDLIEKDGLCFDVIPGEVYIEGSQRIGKYRQVVIDVVACFDRSDCESNVDYSEYIIEVSSPTIRKEYSSYHDPVRMHLNILNVQESSHFSLRREDEIILVPHKILDEHNVLNTKHESKSFITLEKGKRDFVQRQHRLSNGSIDFTCSSSRYDSNSCEVFFRIKYTPSHNRVVEVRKYNKLIDIVGKIGGISTSLLQVFFYINAIYLYFKLY